jgi:hypothetical protein
MLSVGKLLTSLGNIRQNALFFLLILSIIGLFIIQLILMNAWVAIVIVLCVGAILWLNRGLFSFFVRSRGVLISTAFFPIQIMYYLYSLIAFGIGVVTHFFTTTFKVDQQHS